VAETRQKPALETVQGSASPLDRSDQQPHQGNATHNTSIEFQKIETGGKTRGIPETAYGLLFHYVKANCLHRAPNEIPGVAPIIVWRCMEGIKKRKGKDHYAARPQEPVRFTKSVDRPLQMFQYLAAKNRVGAPAGGRNIIGRPDKIDLSGAIESIGSIHADMAAWQFAQWFLKRLAAASDIVNDRILREIPKHRDNPRAHVTSQVDRSEQFALARHVIPPPPSIDALNGIDRIRPRLSKACRLRIDIASLARPASQSLSDIIQQIAKRAGK
jgi:hypothetical protein